jgi:electron transfer flavoprotein beta subunit
VLAGRETVDGNSGIVYAGVACKLGYGLVTNVARIGDVVDGRVTLTRLFEGGQETISRPLPVVISVTKTINNPRYPSFMGMRKAGQAKIPTLGAAELGLPSPSSRVRWSGIRKPAARRAEVRMIEGSSMEEKAARLVEALLAEKAI